MSISTPPTSDLTRWNRAGLSRLHYTDGNAATYLEDLRLALRTQFGSDEDVLVWLGENLTDKNLREWQARQKTIEHNNQNNNIKQILLNNTKQKHIKKQKIKIYTKSIALK
jgi:hypothetical protein